MTTLSVFMDLDYHQAFVQMCVLDSKGTLLLNWKCVNSALALVEAVGVVVSAAIESYCEAADLAEELVSAGRQVSLDARTKLTGGDVRS